MRNKTRTTQWAIKTSLGAPLFNNVCCERQKRSLGLPPNSFNNNGSLQQTAFSSLGLFVSFFISRHGAFCLLLMTVQLPPLFTDGFSNIDEHFPHQQRWGKVKTNGIPQSFVVASPDVMLVCRWDVDMVIAQWSRAEKEADAEWRIALTCHCQSTSSVTPTAVAPH